MRSGNPAPDLATPGPALGSDLVEGFLEPSKRSARGGQQPQSPSADRGITLTPFSWKAQRMGQDLKTVAQVVN
ncbi:unnamed protein product [Gadus morhua 'NCC']